jgi:hypothetical protein
MNSDKRRSGEDGQSEFDEDGAVEAKKEGGMKKAMACCIILAMIVSGLTMIGCGGKKEQAATGETAGETGRPEKKAEQGGRGWSDVPEYRGAQTLAEEVPMSVPAAAQGDYERTEHRQYQTDDTPEQVHEYYLQQMPRKGWHKLFAMKYPEGSAVSAWIKSDRGCVVSTGTLKDGKTYIGQLLNEGKK